METSKMNTPNAKKQCLKTSPTTLAKMTQNVVVNPGKFCNQIFAIAM